MFVTFQLINSESMCAVSSMNSLL